MVLPNEANAKGTNYNWTGNTDTEWNLDANWSSSVPTSSDDATIPSGASNMPTISTSSGAVACKNLTIELGATVTHTGSTFSLRDFKPSGGAYYQSGVSALLDISHDWKPSSSHTFNSSNGTVQFSGSPGGGADFSSPNTQFYTLVVDEDPKFGNKDPGDIKIGGNFTNNVSAGLAFNNTSTFTFNGSADQLITSSAGSNTTFDHLVLDKLGGSVILASDIHASGNITLTQGTLSSGASTGFNLTAGTINLTDNSSIDLGSGSHSISFSASDGVGWTAGRTLTISGWEGAYDGTSGTSGKIYIGASASGLTSSQLDQIQFYDGTSNYPATILSSGELVAADNSLTYCTPINRFSTGLISNVTFNSISNTTSQDVYSDYTSSISTDVELNSTHNLSVGITTTGGYTRHVFTWIDWNLDGDFYDPGEEYDLGETTVNQTLSQNIIVPPGATIGETRMRIIVRYDFNPGPCDTDNFYGEVEDYAVNVIAGCSSPTEPSLSISPNPICAGDDVTIGISGSLNDADHWEIYTGSCGGISIGSSSSPHTSFLINNVTATTTYYVRGEGNSCDGSTCGQVTVTVNSLPACNISGATTVCPSELDVLYSGTAGMSSWAWSIINGDATIDGAGDTENITVDVGTNNFTLQLIVTDGNGCTNTCTTDVLVEDIIAPVFTTSCPNNQNIESSGGYAHSGLSWDMSATDNCVSSPTVTYSLSGVTSGTGTSLNGVTFNNGVTTVLWTATDGTNPTTCSFTVSVSEPGVVPDPIFLSGYCTYKPILITSTENLSNYQIELNVSYDDQMNADFSDIRFSLENGTELDYWIQSYAASTSATVWVEVPTVTSGNNYVYLFYGNSSASSQSDLDATMNSGLLLEYYTYPGGVGPAESSWVLRSRCSDTVNPINYYWSSGSISLCGQSYSDFVVLRWIGFLKKSGTGTNFNFRVGSDDGNRVNLNGGSIELNKWVDQGHTNDYFSFSFTQDVVDIQFDYYENGGGASAELAWDPNGGSSYSVIPEGNYYHATYTANPPSLSTGSEVNNEVTLDFVGSPSSSECEGNSATYTLTNTYDSYNWAISGGSVSSGGGSGDNFVTVSWGSGSNGSVSVDAINGNCSASITHNISIIPDPSYTAPTDVTICIGQQATLSVEFVEGSMSFDGSNDKIDISSSGSINNSIVHNRTISLWFNANNTSTRQVLYEEGGGSHGISIFIDGGSVYVNAWESQVSYGAISSSVSAGNWYHVTFVMDSGESNGDFIKGYLNGNYMGAATDSRASFAEGGLPAHGGDVNIGVNQGTTRFPISPTGSSYNYFGGSIDEFKLWNRSLDQSEIQSVMNRGGSNTSLILDYDFNDESGSYGSVVGATYNSDSPLTPSISWNPGALTGASVDVSPAVTTVYTYTLTVPINSCEEEGTVTVTVSNMNTDASSVTNETCPGGNDGAIDLEVSGGISPYTFVWTTSDGSGLVATDEDQSALPPGTYDVVITDGNSCTKNASFTINAGVDTEAPTVASCPTDINVNVDAGTCGAVVNYTPPTFDDNCDGAGLAGTLTSGLSSGSAFPVGTTTVSYEYNDAAGNASAECSFTVTVAGNEAPRLTCPSGTVPITAASGTCSGTYDWLAILNIDVCNAYTLAWIRDDGETDDAEKFNFAVGTTVVDVTVTDDVNGLQTTCQITVFVDEDLSEDPIITAPGDLTVSCLTAVPTALTVDDFDGSTLSDNCGIQNSSFSVTDVTVNNGDGSQTITRTYSISDFVGNMVSDDQVITVSNDLEVNASITIVPACSGELMQITATTNGFSSPIYQWQEDTGSGFADISGANALALEMSSHSEGNKYHLLVSEGGCSVSSSELTLTYDDLVAPVFDVALDLNYSGCIPNGQSTASITGIGLTNATQVSDNCTSFSNLKITYAISGATTANSPATGQHDASDVTYNVGTSTVVYTVTDESNQSDTYSFDVVINNEPEIQSISSDGTPSTDGSGYLPYQGSIHNYGVTNEAGFNYSWRVENSSAIDITSSLTISGQGTSNFSITWGAASMPGNYLVYVAKENQTTACDVETSLAVTVLNNFDPKVQNFGDACHSVNEATLMEFRVYLEPGTRVAPSWSFDWELYLNGGVMPVQTGNNINVAGADDTTISLTVVVGDGSEKNYRFVILNGQDSLGNLDNDTSSLSNEDLVKIFTKPDIGF